MKINNAVLTVSTFFVKGGGGSKNKKKRKEVPHLNNLLAGRSRVAVARRAEKHQSTTGVLFSVPTHVPIAVTREGKETGEKTKQKWRRAVAEDLCVSGVVGVQLARCRPLSYEITDLK